MLSRLSPIFVRSEPASGPNSLQSLVADGPSIREKTRNIRRGSDGQGIQVRQLVPGDPSSGEGVLVPIQAPNAGELDAWGVRWCDARTGRMQFALCQLCRIAREREGAAHGKCARRKADSGQYKRNVRARDSSYRSASAASPVRPRRAARRRVSQMTRGTRRTRLGRGRHGRESSSTSWRAVGVVVGAVEIVVVAVAARTASVPSACKLSAGARRLPARSLSQPEALCGRARGACGS